MGLETGQWDLGRGFAEWLSQMGWQEVWELARWGSTAQRA